jgi:hypothetical protein
MIFALWFCYRKIVDIRLAEVLSVPLRNVSFNSVAAINAAGTKSWIRIYIYLF